MRQGIHTFADADDLGAHASRIHVRCASWTHVGQTRRCSGTFRLTRKGKHADYRLNSAAGTMLNTRHSVMYRVAATTEHPTGGLPADTGEFSGFYPR
jgi:hypothetical protein